MHNESDSSIVQTHCFYAHKAKKHLAKKISLCLVLMKINFLAHCNEKSRKCVKKIVRNVGRLFFFHADDNYVPWKVVGGIYMVDKSKNISRIVKWNCGRTLVFHFSATVVFEGLACIVYVY